MSHVRAILVACGPLSLFRPSQAGINLKKASNLFLAGPRKKKYKRQQKKNQTFKFLHLYLSSKWALAIVTRPILKERTRIFPTRPLKEKNKGLNFKCLVVYNVLRRKRAYIQMNISGKKTLSSLLYSGKIDRTLAAFPSPQWLIMS